MKIPWIQVNSNLAVHPKTYKLADVLHITCSSVSANIVTAGMLVSLWSWAAQTAPDGNLTACTPRAIADAAGWRRKPETFLQALITTGWVDRDDTTLRIHDWADYASLLMEQVENQKTKTKERVKRYRERKANETVTLCVDECNGACNVTETLSNASTIPNHTIPNLVGTNVPTTHQTSLTGDEAAVTPYPAEAVMLCEYFEDNCHQVRSLPLLNALTASLESGATADMLRAVIDDTALRGADSPAKYLCRVLETLRGEKIYDLTAFTARQERHKAKGGGGKHAKTDGVPTDAKFAGLGERV